MMWTNSNSPRRIDTPHSPHVNPWAAAPSSKHLPPINTTPPRSPPRPVNDLWLPAQSLKLPPINTTPPRSPPLPMNNLLATAPSPKHLPPIDTSPRRSLPLPMNNLLAAAPNPHSLPPIDTSPPRPVNDLLVASPNPQYLPLIAPPTHSSIRKRAIQILDSLAEFYRNQCVCPFDGLSRCKNKDCKFMHHAELGDAIRVLWDNRKYLIPVEIIKDLGAVCSRETTCGWENSTQRCKYRQACHRIHPEHLLYAANSLWFIVHPPY